MTPHLRPKIRTRNHICRTIHQNWQLWIYVGHEATKAINEAKTKNWKDLFQNTMSNSYGPNMWKFIQDLNGTLDANSLNKAMSHNGWTFTDIKFKANVFINRYSRISKLNTPSADEESCAPLHMGHQNLPSKKWKVKEHLALTTFHLHFSNLLVHSFSRNYYLFSGHLFYLLIAHASQKLPQPFHYWMQRNLQMKHYFSAPSVSHHVSSNFWNVFLLIVSIISPKLITFSVD